MASATLMARIRAPLGIAALLILVLAVAAALLAPYVYPEVEYRLQGPTTQLLPKPTGEVSGRWYDDYFLVEQIDASTFAIGEPRYYQGNYSYLLLGTSRAVLFDAGTGTRDIVPVVRSLTTLPVTVIPSHLHYDHVGALGRFDRTALIDDPGLRARTHDGVLQLGRYEFLGFLDDLPAPSFRVDEWWKPDTTIDLGGRQVQVIATPGHTPTSVSLYDARNKEVFVGDFVYPGNLYVFLPGASRSAYLTTTRKLLRQLNLSTRVFCAHMAEPPAPVRAPMLTLDELQSLDQALVALDAGRIVADPNVEFQRLLKFPRVFVVNGDLRIATGFPWNDQ
ncbi:MAG: MBL fold metallo-hydrolase [Proteobacteria bacterium]|nr:MBL fold metallo-hydrolase [Pseudomonadota bacterium]